VGVDAAGNLYVADEDGYAIEEIYAVNGAIPASPTIVTLYKSSPYTPYAVVTDSAGDVFFIGSQSLEIPMATPPSLSFASTSVGNTSASQTLDFQNVGNTSLTFPIPTSGTNPALSSNLTLSNSSTCPQLTTSTSSAQTLAYGAPCTAIVSFSPVMPGSQSTGITFYDNSLNVATASQSVGATIIAAAATGTTAQTITFPQPTTPAQAGTNATLTATSGLAIRYRVISGPATLNGSTVTYTGAGTVVLEADQYGNDTYAPATVVQRTVMVGLQGAVGGSGTTLTATVTIATAATLGAIDVLTTGQPNLDYVFVAGGTCATGTVYAANATCTVNYNLTPKAPGQRLGAVQLVDSTGAVVMGTTLLTGTGTGAAAVFPGNTSTATLGSGFSQPRVAAVDAAGNIYVADNGNSLVKEIPSGCTSASCVSARGSGFSSPTGAAVDGAGNIYVADTGNSEVKEIVAVRGNHSRKPDDPAAGRRLQLSLRCGSGRRGQCLRCGLRQQRGEGRPAGDATQPELREHEYGQHEQRRPEEPVWVRDLPARRA
jgi:hypothetical protein